jgi:2-oxoglutarate dehydrogenase E2 component (dihydrolipoamide succinyltransferase)
MSIEVKVPVLPESVADATIAAWHKKPGDAVSRDENLLDLETDKVVLEVPAPADGVLEACLFQVGDTVVTGQVLAQLKAGAAAPETKSSEPSESKQNEDSPSTGPAVRRLMDEHGLNPADINGSGKDGRITKQDVEAFIASTREQASNTSSAPIAAPIQAGAREEKRVPMSRLRVRIAERLLQAQHESAMLTTFNEVNLKAVMDLRAEYKQAFEKKHGVKLGFMSFFTRAVVESLKRFPSVNASIDGKDVVYHGYYDIGVAVSTERGLVVPVIRDADTLSMASIEQTIGDLAGRARDGKLAMEDMQGGNFTITNGGVFGSLLSTPILNPPQAAILGMHKIQEKPVVEAGEIVIRPMMYLALSYDHRLIDGRESVQFLVSVKELLEDPSRLLLDI